MISIDEIDKAILDLEAHDTTFATCEKLAWLYTVRDHISPANVTRETVKASGSEFLNACAGKDIEKVLAILDEHLQIINALYPREYIAILSKLNDI